MTRPVLCAITVLFASSLFGQTADLEVALSAPSIVYFGEPVRWTASVTNLGADPAIDVWLESSLSPGPPCLSPKIPTLRVGESYTLSCSGELIDRYRRTTWSIFARAASHTHDPNVDNHFKKADIRAATTDFVVTMNAPPTARAGTPVTWSASGTNLGPDTARDVTLRTYIDLDAECVREIPFLASGETHTLSCSATPIVPSYTREARADVRSLRSHDPDPSNNYAGAPIQLLSPPDLIIFMNVSSAIDPDLPFELSVGYGNWAHTTATDVTIVIDVPETRGFQRVPDFCRVMGTRVTCEVGEVPSTAATHEFRPIGFNLEPIATSDGSGAPMLATATISANEPDNIPESNRVEKAFAVFRTFYVTNRNDAGDGSLRVAIESANAECDEVPCKIAFRIEPTGEEKWQTIRPLTPLPTIVGTYLSIDGTMQSRFFGDRNELGPEIEIRGEALRSGDGLELAGEWATEVRSLIINGFPGNGIAIRGMGTENTPSYGGVLIADCYVGTDPTGMHAVPNTRGIFADRLAGYPIYVIEGNLIGGNARAGIFSGRGIRLVQRNLIGINRDQSGPLGNGASGIYVGPLSSGTDITDNAIAFNEHFGVAIDAKFVALHGNSIHANWQGGIDIGLDGTTTTIIPMPQYPPVTLPTIRSARYDPAENLTVIEGEVDPTYDHLVANLYANDAPDPSGYGEGQYFLGAVQIVDRRFTLRHAGDLRGKWITATLTQTIYTGFKRTLGTAWGFLTTTSEFSRAIAVAP